MRSRETDRTTESTIRKALSAVLGRTDGRTIIEECRQCGTTVESATVCPSCGDPDIVTYRIK